MLCATHARLPRYAALPVDLRRSVNGAIAGTVAAAAWAAQQPLDKRAFRCANDDVELLGKLVVAGDAWPITGMTLHLQNGAAFGAAYAQLRRFVPGPPLVVGLGLAIVEHLATWPLGGLIDRVHPRRRELVRLRGNRRAFWQAAWRHAVFGLLLAELERRLNADRDDEPLPVPVSSNGHGNIELAVGAA